MHFFQIVWSTERNSLRFDAGSIVLDCSLQLCHPRDVEHRTACGVEGVEKHLYCGSDHDCKHLRGDHWGASGDGMGVRVPMARREQFGEYGSINDHDSGDG